jgi:hypothetical protein
MVKQKKTMNTRKSSKESSNNMLLSNEITRVIKWSTFVQYTASGLSIQTFRLNSLYDPDETGAGTQPVGFDEIMAFYYYYRVESVKVKITVVNGGTAAITAVQLSNSATDPTQITAMAANNSGRAEMSAGTYGQNRSVITYNVNIKNWLGFKENIDTDLLGTVSSSPARVVFLHIGMEEIDLSAKDISLFCEFEFNTRFVNPVPLNNS